MPESSKTKTSEPQATTPKVSLADSRERTLFIENWKERLKLDWMKRIVDDFTNPQLNDFRLFKITDKKGNESFMYVLWLYEDPKAYGALGQPIPKEVQERYKSSPEEIKFISQFIAESYAKSMDFYEWASAPRGIRIVKGNFGGFEAGDIFGIQANYDYIDYGSEMDLKDEKVRLRLERVAGPLLASIMIHERTHIQREENVGLYIAKGGIHGWTDEIASHVSQFISDTKTNVMFYKELDESLANIRKYREAKEKGEDFKDLTRWNLGQYAALLILAEAVSETNKRFGLELIRDKDPNKLNALAKLREFITGKDIESFRKEKLPKLMDPDENPAKEYDRVAKMLGTVRVEDL